MADDVPDDILQEDILSRLPVTDLLRCRCVCKLWKGLIDCPRFINHHLNHSRKSNSNLEIFFTYFDDFVSEDFDVLTNTRRLRYLFPWRFNPFRVPSFDTEILGSCNGLLVLSTLEDNIILWNPSIRRFRNIPVFTGMKLAGEYCSRYIVYGFGYDRVLDDYKLVRIVQYYVKGTVTLNSQVMVYSVNRNSWKQIADFPYFLRVRLGNGEFVNGALHWVVERTKVMDSKYDKVDCLVGAFDLETEDYRLVPLPRKVVVASNNSNKFRIMNLGSLGGCLTVMCDEYEAYDHVDIWVMKEYGVEESWSFLFRLSRSKEFCYWSPYDVVKPMAYSHCGRRVLIGSSCCVFMWYDLDRKCCDLPLLFAFELDDMEFIDFHNCFKCLVMLNNNSISDCDFEMAPKNEKTKWWWSYRNLFLNSWFN